MGQLSPSMPSPRALGGTKVCMITRISPSHRYSTKATSPLTIVSKRSFFWLWVIAASISYLVMVPDRKIN